VILAVCLMPAACTLGCGESQVETPEVVESQHEVFIRLNLLNRTNLRAKLKDTSARLLARAFTGEPSSKIPSIFDMIPQIVFDIDAETYYEWPLPPGAEAVHTYKTAAGRHETAIYHHELLERFRRFWDLDSTGRLLSNDPQSALEQCVAYLEEQAIAIEQGH
jgi:hypothetical protein